MKHIITLCTAAIISASAPYAAPLCDAFISADTMPQKYRKQAPVLSAGPADWIITADQLDTDYVPNAEAAALLAQIVAEFENRGTKLAILMPPPRPLIAGQPALDTLAGGKIDYDVDAVSASFNAMIDVVRGAGAIAPNLLDLATRDDALRDAFYYRHDTHWTPRGAAESAVALAQAVIAADIPAFENSEIMRPQLDSDNRLSERGSLAYMTKAVCGIAIPPVELTVPEFPVPEMGLLETSSNRPHILLAGSSFSNRYKKDAYRVADAISAALQADVSNHSVSGGGAIGAIEGILNAGLLDTGKPVDLIVWEIPYTQGLQSIGMLRQLLGALRFDPRHAPNMVVPLNTAGKTQVTFDADTPDVLAVNLPNRALQRLKIDLRFDDGSKQTLALVRKHHVPAALQSDWWAVSLADLNHRNLTSATIRYAQGSISASAKAHVISK